MRELIDNYITPLLRAESPDFSQLGVALISLAATYAIGILCAYGYNRIMVNISQSTLKRFRIELFTHIESLPIKYFDTHAHGDIMSVYTNDVDTLLQLISQSVPQVINSFVTIMTTLVSMIALDIPLTLLTLLMVGITLFVSAKLSGKSGQYFAQQQKDLGTVNGYIEEMMEGQKVVKVFCYEEKSVEQFRNLNQQLRRSANNAKMDNIRYGRLEATDEECIAAAKLANADSFIRHLPDGYQTMLTGDGANLSQGQRQLLAIARAAVADPPVLILDEATSSIDTRTESLVQEGMDLLMQGRTTFVIAHRLSTVRNSDCIMVLEHGRIIERGTHDQLIDQKVRYYQLYTGNAIEA